MNRRAEQLHRYRIPTWLLLAVSAAGFLAAIAMGGDQPADASPLQPAPVVLVLDDESTGDPHVQA